MESLIREGQVVVVQYVLGLGGQVELRERRSNYVIEEGIDVKDNFHLFIIFL